MPQIKEIATHFKGKSVVVLGMNTDDAESEARFVIEKMELNYPNLKAKGLAQNYGVIAYPTLVIIDQKGLVRQFHVGYLLDLRTRVIAAVEKILSGG